MNNASRVGEIFTSAGAALNLLGELTMQLESAGPSAPGSGTKWTDQEINMLQNAVANFANDLNLISETIKSRTVQQIKNTLQRKAYDDANLAMPSHKPQGPQLQQLLQAKEVSRIVEQQTSTSGLSSSSADVTLNMLNAEADVDVEGLGPPSAHF